MPDDDPLSAHELAVLAWEAYTRNQVADAGAPGLARIGRRGVVARVAIDRKSRWCASRSPASRRARTASASDHLGEFPHDDLVRRVKDASA